MERDPQVEAKNYRLPMCYVGNRRKPSAQNWRQADNELPTRIENLNT